MEEHNYSPEEFSSNENPPSQAATNSTPAATEKSQGFGPVIGIVVIILLLILGGLYFWGTELNKQAALDEMQTLDESMNNGTLSSDSDPEEIESDIDAFETSTFDAQLEADIQALEEEL